MNRAKLVTNLRLLQAKARSAAEIARSEAEEFTVSRVGGLAYQVGRLRVSTETMADDLELLLELLGPDEEDAREDAERSAYRDGVPPDDNESLGLSLGSGRY